MESSILESLKKIKGMDKESLFGKMEESMMGVGFVESKVELVITKTQMESDERVLG